MHHLTDQTQEIRLSCAKAEAIANADAHLQNVGLTTYSEAIAALRTMFARAGANVLLDSDEQMVKARTALSNAPKAEPATNPGTATSKFFCEIAIGTEFWFDGKVWTKASYTQATSETTTLAVHQEEVVMSCH